MAHCYHSEKKSTWPIAAIDQIAFRHICFQDGDCTHLKRLVSLTGKRKP